MADVMPIGNRIDLDIRPSQVETTEGNAAAPVFHDDAAATIVWDNFQRAKNYVENNTWLLEWQETDILYQSPIPNRFTKVEQGRPARVSRFLVAKFTRTLARAVKRGLFAEQTPFFLRPTGKANQQQIDAWTALLTKLMKRAKFPYYAGLVIDCMVLQGTGIAKAGVETRTVTKKTRKAKAPTMKVDMPMGKTQEIHTTDSDEFELIPETKTETWPWLEYRRLGTTLFDPKWCTPDMPDESAGYSVDVDYVTFADLQEMRKLDCYKNIPDDETLKNWFMNTSESATQPASQVTQAMSAQGSIVMHAEGQERKTDADPLKKPVMKIEQWDTRTCKAILYYEGRKLLIRNDEHEFDDTSLHYTTTWWPVDNAGYGMGIGRIAGSDQRINQGIINECLKMIAYPFNAPVLHRRGDNAPTQNVIQRFGGFWSVDAPPGTDLRKEVAFMEMPAVPADAWKMLELSQRGAEELTGANAPFAQGNLGGPGSSAARTATGAGRISAMSDQNVADPIDSFAQGIIIPFVNFLIQVVKYKMPMSEIREMLSDKHAAVIEGEANAGAWLDATFDVDVLAGQKLAARQSIQQLIPFFLQIVQQPQLLEYLHQRGETIDFSVIMDLLLQVSELTQQPDIFRPLTQQEMKVIQSMNPGAQKVAGAVQLESVRGKNKIAQIHEKGQVDLATKAAETVMEHASDGIPLMRAEGLTERGEDEGILKNGLQGLQ